ncbi:MAG: carbohydrate kinase family protein [Clostridia bacterium]|nr:carbohydrate kinase family protein [Clostridia bacterium]MBQ6959450.1 carbohydrate kinase family protein [Clostridia bacterium]
MNKMMENGNGRSCTVTVVGGMNLDLLATPDVPLLARDSTPGKITLRPGGVGRNIAARLSEAGAHVRLITALGCDERAGMLSRLCRESGIDLSLSVATPCPAPCYLCIHDDKGDMVLAVNDMSAMERLTPEAMESRMEALNQSDACVLDANLSCDTLSYIAAHASVPLILDPVSCAKAARAKDMLPFLAAIKPNRMEAEALTGERNIEKAAAALLRAGVKHVFISLGAEGVYYADASGAGYEPARPLPTLPATGAGDALCAGLTLALLSGMDIQACARAGQEAAYRALLQSKDA